jgi:hypothetical protein
MKLYDVGTMRLQPLALSLCLYSSSPLPSSSKIHIRSPPSCSLLSSSCFHNLSRSSLALLALASRFVSLAFQETHNT